jgi:hypothetical protein
VNEEWSDGVATCRADCAAYDVASCTRADLGGRYEMVKPAERDPSLWAAARCNTELPDQPVPGTAFGLGVRLSPTRSPLWIVHLQGGGFCDQHARPCSPARGSLLVTPPHPDRAAVDLGPRGVVSDDPALNPELDDANHVFALYCSSDTWAGSGGTAIIEDGGEWTFAGRANVRATFEVLIQRFGSRR